MESGFLHETKTILKSLVISCPNGMTVDRLNRDYKETVGGWIPFKKLGYQSLELFLKSIPDTLVLTGHGREARVGFVASDKTQHINEMISHQKNTTRDRKSAVRNRPVQYLNHQPPPIHYNPQAVLAANLYQTQLYNQAVGRIYCSYNPNAFPLNNMVQFYQPPTNIYTSAIMQAQRQSQNSRTVKYKATTDVNSNKKIETPPEKINSKNLLIEIDENDEKTQTETNTSDNLSSNLSKTSISNGTTNSRRMLSEPSSLKKVLVDIKNSNNTTNSNSQSDDKWTNSKDNVNTEQSLPKSTDKITFPSKSLKAPTTNGKISSPQLQTETEATKKPPATESQSVEKSTKKTISKQLPSVPAKFSSRKKLTEKIIKYPNLQTVVETKVLASNNSALKKNDTKADSNMSETVSTKNNMNTSKYLTDPFAPIDSSDDDIDAAVPEFAADFKVFHVDFPENTVPFGKKIPSVQLPTEFTKGAVVGVFISEIHSPFKFWFHPHKENHELDFLMSSIESFYERLGDADLLIPRSCITPGQVCVALYNAMWHRAEILSTISKNKVKVLFVDYGTVSNVEIQHIKYLQNRFAETPMQAIRGSLSHIKPLAVVWQKKAINEFLSLVAEVFLYAQIVEIDEKEKTVYMVLCDTNSGETIQINKLLVDRGFARLDSEWDEDKIKKNGYRKRHPKDIFPTFEMLETGEYPSLYELDQLLTQGIDYEKITEKIILSNFNSNNFYDKVSTHIDKMSFNLLDTNPFKSDIISEIISLKMFDK